MFRNIMQATASLGPKNIYCGTGPLSGSLQCKGDRSLVAISLCKVLKIVLDFQLFSVNTGANRETTATLKGIVFNKQTNDWYTT